MNLLFSIIIASLNSLIPSFVIRFSLILMLWIFILKSMIWIIYMNPWSPISHLAIDISTIDLLWNPIISTIFTMASPSIVFPSITSLCSFLLSLISFAIYIMPRALIPQSPMLNLHTWDASLLRTAWERATAPRSPKGFRLRLRSERTFIDEKRCKMSLEEAGVISQLKKLR